MLDMGFIHSLRQIAKHLPLRRQTMLFSIGLPGGATCTLTGSRR